MKNEIAYNKLQRHADCIIMVLVDYIPPKYSKPSQWLNLDRIISDVKTLQFADFHNATMIFDIYNILTCQVVLDIITRDKLTEFICALSENPQAEPMAEFIRTAHKYL